MKELALMKGNEAIAEAAIRAGVDGYFGYPITAIRGNGISDAAETGRKDWHGGSAG